MTSSAPENREDGLPERRSTPQETRPDAQGVPEGNPLSPSPFPNHPRYELRDRLGEGATALVYRGWDRELARPVALKVLRELAGLSEVARQRFRREAHVGAGLAHPNVIRVYDIVEVDGRLCLVLELVEGRSLAGVLRDDHLELPELVRLVEEAAQGVAAAHGKGIVHRDLKPANILVTASGQPKVGDFGLAHLLETSTDLTRTGTPLGTPLYMSPEQVQGRTDQISPRTDVYGLGAILYEALTGSPPITGQTTAEIYARISHEDPRPPRSLNPKVSPDLQTIALKALEKEPERRYESAGPFADDLRRALAGEPIAARPVTTLERLIRKAAKHRAAVLAAVAGTLLAAWAAASVRSNSARTQAREEARALLDSASPAFDLATTYLYRKDAPQDEMLQRIEEAKQRIEAALRRDPTLAPAQQLLGRAWKLQGWEDCAEASFREALRLDPEFAPAHHELGRLLMERFLRVTTARSIKDVGRRWIAGTRIAAEASRELEIALSSKTGFDDPLQREVVRGLRAYAAVDKDALQEICTAAIRRFGDRPGVEDFHWLLGLSSREEQIEEFTKALALRPGNPLVLLFRASAHAARGDAERAQDDCDQALRLNPRLAEGYLYRSTLHGRRGDRDAESRDLDEAIRVRPDFADAYVHRGVLFSNRHDWEAATRDLNRALELDRESTSALYFRSIVRMGKQDMDGAVADLDAAIALDPGYATAFSARAIAWAGKGKADLALADLDAALRLNPRHENALQTRASILLSRQDYEGALRDATALVETNARDGKGFFIRALARMARNQPDPAVEDFTRAIELLPTFGPAYARRGVVRLQLGDRPGALQDIERALDLGSQGREREELERLRRQLKEK